MTLARVAGSLMALTALSTVHAFAASGAVTTTVNLRQGPGTTYTAVGKIPAGATVEIGDCSGQWCQVTWQGQSGYVIATSLVEGGGAPPSGQRLPPPGAIAGGPPPPPPGYDLPPDYDGPPGYPPPPPYPYYGYYRPYYGGYGPYYYGYGRRRW